MTTIDTDHGISAPIAVNSLEEKEVGIGGQKGRGGGGRCTKNDVGRAEGVDGSKSRRKMAVYNVER